MSRYVSEEDRLTFAVSMGLVAPNHVFVATPAGCGRCPQASPFRWSEEKHPYVIEEEPV